MMNRMIFYIMILANYLAAISCQRNLDCDTGYQCIGKDDCDEYQEYVSKFNSIKKIFGRNSKEKRELLTKMKNLVCNRKLKRVCCKVPSVVNRGANTKSNDPSSPSYVPTGDACGVANGHAGFIVGGKQTGLGEFPWMVLLGKDKPTGAIIWHCGGTLINKWFVLTAAHCSKVNFVRLGEWKVEDTNTYDSQNCVYYNPLTEKQCLAARFCRRWCKKKEKADYDCQGQYCSSPHQDIRIEYELKHPDYRETVNRLAINDIMLLKLQKPAEFNLYVSPICLPDIRLTDRFGEIGHNSLNNGFGIAVGWGKTQTSADDDISIVSTAQQQEVDLPVISLSQCIDKYQDLFRLNLSRDLSLNEHFCAGGDIGKDSCSGDSGGPLIARNSDIESYMIVGVVSGGTKRCGRGAPGIFTRVSNYKEWIIKNLK